jgi:hypothetical protein
MVSAYPAHAAPAAVNSRPECTPPKVYHGRLKFWRRQLMDGVKSAHCRRDVPGKGL